MPKWFRCEVCSNVYSNTISSYPNDIGSVCPSCGVSENISQSFKNKGINSLWHITHINNLLNISEKGILNHYAAHHYNPKLADISDPNAQKWRENFENCFNRRIHEYAPLYISPKNPMLYKRREIQNVLCLVEVSLSVLTKSEYLITDGNAVSRDTIFFKNIDSIPSITLDVLNAKYWNDFDDGKRRKCAEVLIYQNIAPEHIKMIHCCSGDSFRYISGLGMSVSLSNKLFFMVVP